jgi:hypothetical protein
MYIHIHICIYVCVCECVCVCVCVCAHMHTCMRVFLRARVCIRQRRDAQVLQELALAEPLGERLHLRGVDGPAAQRARMRPAPAAKQWTDVDSNARIHRKSPRMHAQTLTCT